MGHSRSRFSDFTFDFDEDLLARAHRPADDVNLVVVNSATNEITYDRFLNIVDHLPSGSFSVWNDTKAGPSQLSGRHASGAPLEVCFLIDRDTANREWDALILSPDKDPPEYGAFLLAGGAVTGTIAKKISGFNASYWNEKNRYSGFRGLVRLDQKAGILPAVMEREGSIIHPWYTDLNSLDPNLLNPITATRPGSVCPSLPARRFTSQLLDDLDAKSIRRIPVSLEMNFSWNLHGSDTRLDEYVMNEERYTVSDSSATDIMAAVANDRELIAIGTSGVRVVESAWPLRAGSGFTSLFVRPGFEFRAITGLLTNLHVPQSTHVIMAAAVGGREVVLRALAQAAARRYRFGVHGDALLVLSGGRRRLVGTTHNRVGNYEENSQEAVSQ